MGINKTRSLQIILLVSWYVFELVESTAYDYTIAGCPQQCIFTYDGASMNDTSSTFSQCRVQTTCMLSKSTLQCSSNGAYCWNQTVCLNYFIEIYSAFDNCTLNCCDPNMTYANSFNTVKLCSNYWVYGAKEVTSSTVNGQTIGLIVGVSLGAILLIVIITCICCKIKRNSERYKNQEQDIVNTMSQFNPFQNQSFNHPHNPALALRLADNFQKRKFQRQTRNINNKDDINNNSYAQFTRSNTGTTNNTNLKESQHNLPHQNIVNNNERSTSSNCPVCLEENALLEFSCGHFYHIKCAYSWLLRKNKCAICQRESIKQKLFKIYCSRCHVKNKYMTIKEIGRILTSEQTSNKDNAQSSYLCVECQKI